MAKSLADKAYALGKKYEKAYRGCCQCTIAALQDTFGIRNDDVFKAGTALSGGGALCTDGNCGAYTGALMVLSSILGRERSDFKDTGGVRGETNGLARQFHEKFIQEYGSVVCAHLQAKIFGRSYYLADPDEAAKFHEAGAHTVHCPEVVGKAARWMAEVIVAADLLP